MKKHLIILLILFSSCSGQLRKPDTKSSDLGNSKIILKRPDTTISKNKSANLESIINKRTTLSLNQNKSYIKFKKFKNDSLRYIQTNFIDNKNIYIGKDLNNLLKDLELSVKSYIPSSSYTQNNASPELILLFYPVNQIPDKMHSRFKPVNIIIDWVTPLPQDSVLILMNKSKNTWREEERKFYGKRIIKDIFTTKYDK